MKVEFKAKLTRKEMFSFLINNAYRKPMGVVMFLFGIGCYVVAVLTYSFTYFTGFDIYDNTAGHALEKCRTPDCQESCLQG